MEARRLARASRLTVMLVVAIASAASLSSCHRDGGDEAQLRTMGLTAALVPASPTNAHADDPLAAALGRRFFFDKRLSVDASIACASCHDPGAAFSDPRAFSVGVRGQLGDRHAMPITAAALHPFTLWDGRSDSLWAQPLKAIENPKEMDFTRVEVARLMADVYASDYEDVFGALPPLDGIPTRGKPGMPAWDALDEGSRTAIDRVAANVGKALEAYERQVLCADTRFDQWTRGEIDFSDAETAGARAFVEHRCTGCHTGPSFSDGQFHNVGIPSTDVGRSAGREQLSTDPFNGVGVHSDDPVAGAARLAVVSQETGTVGAFRTASLRGVGQRTFFGHASHQQTLRGFIVDVYAGRRGGRRAATVGTLDPKLNDVDLRGDDVDDLVTFLRTLDCPTPAAELLAP